MTLQTNSTFQQVIDELTRMGDEATRKAIDDPVYQRFVQAFPIQQLPNLRLTDYCVGKGDGSSFCWWLERGLQPVLGRYMPGTARGHILYFQKDGSVYKIRQLKDLSDNEALRYTLLVQTCIAQADVTKDLTWIDDDHKLFERAGVDPRVSVGDGRKLRLLSCYHPEDTLPISSSSHIGEFLLSLGCSLDDVPPQKRPVARMLLLRKYFELARQSVPGLSPSGFMKALYSERLSIAPKRDSDTADDTTPGDASSAPGAHLPSSSETTHLPLNQILYGPPGTGKTYATIDESLAILDPAYLAQHRTDRPALKSRFDALAKEQRVRFVTFHQSFSYEDFVEGLRATTNDDTGQLRYEVVDGIFKSICTTAQALASPQEETGITVKGRRIWKMSLGDVNGPDAEVYDECLQNNCILLGYGGKIDFSDCSTRAEVAERYRANGIAIEDVQHDYAITSVLTFVTQMSKGDLVVVTEGNLKFRAIGEITGDYAFKAHPILSGNSQLRPVRWLRKYSPSLPYAELMNNRFSQMTLYELREGSIDLDKLQNLLNGHGTSSPRLHVGPLGSSGYAITRVTDDLIEVTKPNGNKLPFSKAMLQVLADGVVSDRISIEDIRNKQAIEKLPGKGLEPHLVNGYNNVLAPLVEKMCGLGPNAFVTESAFKDAEARVLIIDEINRGNISRIFGELITLIEPSKRARSEEALEVVLPYSKKTFSVPNNVYLIGTMNTADRSLAAMDVALRRRFVFKEMPPRLGLLEGVTVGAIPIDVMLKVINQRIEALLGRDHCLGHAYFMPLRSNDSISKLAEIFRGQVLPLLQEYFFDDWQRIQWVLNDHRKRSAAYRFVTMSEADTSFLFGQEVNPGRTTQLWTTNLDAFLCEESYLGVINHEDAAT